MSKKDFVFSVMLGFFIMATLLNLIISIVTGDIMVWMCTVLDAVTLILFIIWNKLNKKNKVLKERANINLLLALFAIILIL